MDDAIPDIKKKRGRPATGIGTPVLVRLTPEIVSAIDARIADADGRGEKISRPDVVRDGVADKLKRDGYLT